MKKCVIISFQLLVKRVKQMNNNNFVRKIVMYFECNVKFWSDFKKIVKIAKLIKILQELISFDFKFQNMLYMFKYTAFNCDNNFHAVYPSFDIFYGGSWKNKETYTIHDSRVCLKETNKCKKLVQSKDRIFLKLLKQTLYLSKCCWYLKCSIFCQIIVKIRAVMEFNKLLLKRTQFKVSLQS